MSFKISGKPLDIKCNEPVIPEFPTLLFGKHPDKDTLYYNAEGFCRDNPDRVLQFLSIFQQHIDSIKEYFSIENIPMVAYSTSGEILLEYHTVYLFLMFIDPNNYLGYITERTHELFSEGFCVSDTYLLNSAKHRIDNNTLKKLIDENGE